MTWHNAPFVLQWLLLELSAGRIPQVHYDAYYEKQMNKVEGIAQFGGAYACLLIDQ